jgi:two-component system, cell cycle sensor histidine kinase and response regulator CckA
LPDTSPLGEGSGAVEVRPKSDVALDEELAGTARTPASPGGEGKTILLAEDEQHVRTFVLDMLQRQGYNVIAAVDGRDALEQSRTKEGPIHLLLADVQMPHMNGVELATQLQIDRPNMHILLMSGLAAGIVLLNEGWHFLPKPFMRDMLRLAVEHALEGAPAAHESPGGFGVGEDA